ncbi:MAG: four helix bundle protein [Candidatus Cloacimonetes bacterium]|jgi:four helix bundle protein|nr:four helix bundle protein [Candidatus Cloacimonadota bacterium]
MYSYRDLDVYKISLDLVLDVYSETQKFPQSEMYGLISQMRRCAVSIPSNIAEGSGRHSTKEFIQFLYVSNASLSELETQLEISKRLGYINDVEHISCGIGRVRVMLNNLIRALNEKKDKQ